MKKSSFSSVMETLCVILAIYCFSNVFVAANISASHPDTYLTITQLAKKYGYPMENHEVITEDGYILTMFRIPHGKNGTGINRKPILLMHGLFGQAENFIVNGMHNGSLAYLLADNGYDVWLGNSRGTAHSRKHINLKPEMPKFWNFSWHEIGMFDLAAKIDYILSEVNKKRIYYVGYSQGGTTFLVLCSERPEYQNKIIAAPLLAPATYMTHTSDSIFRFFSVENRLDVFMESAERNGVYEFPNQKNSLKNILNSMCFTGNIFDDLCHGIINRLSGGISTNTDPEILALLIQSLPTVSIRQIAHYLQEIRSGRFCKWDYGTREKNIVAYGVPEPPDYHIQKVTVPIVIYSGLGDAIVSTKDASRACEELANCRRNVIIPDPNWTHGDFFCATNQRKMVNEPVLDFINEH